MSLSCTAGLTFCSMGAPRADPGWRAADAARAGQYNKAARGEKTTHRAPRRAMTPGSFCVARQPVAAQIVAISLRRRHDVAMTRLDPHGGGAHNTRVARMRLGATPTVNQQGARK